MLGKGLETSHLERQDVWALFRCGMKGHTIAQCPDRFSLGKGAGKGFASKGKSKGKGKGSQSEREEFLRRCLHFDCDVE